MSDSDLMTPAQLALEMDVGPATIRYWLKRFDAWLPHTLVKGEACYSRDILPTLFFIAQELEAGRLPSRIEEALKQKAPRTNTSPKKEADHPAAGQLDEILKENGLGLFQGLMENLGSQQERIARAHERRAEAEERKADAIEKRALAEQKKADAIEKRAHAEEKKAEAMNNIAKALQSMKHEVFPGKTSGTMALETAGAIAMDEAGLDEADLDEVLRDDPPHDSVIEMDDLSTLINGQESEKTEPTAGMDDLSMLVGEEEMDDLSLLTGKKEESEPPEPVTGMDDLSLLVENEHPQPAAGMDDLSTLVEKEMDDLSLLTGKKKESEPLEPVTGMDDLSLLVENEHPQPTAGMDDLSMLVGKEMDDLSLLTGKKEESPPPEPVTGMDDLSLLVENEHPQPTAGMDDLSMLVGKEKNEANGGDKVDDPASLVKGDGVDGLDSLKPDITPEEDFKGYKTAIINTLIRLKKEGVSVEEAARRFNEEGVLTLTGKQHWGTKAIAKIYSFIKI